MLLPGRPPPTGTPPRGRRRGARSRRSGRPDTRRPETRRRTRGRAAAEAGASRVTLTGRAATLALVLLVLAITLAYPLRTYLAQRSQIAALRAQQQAQQQRVTAYEREQARWQDPTYIKEQAERRLHYVLPGESALVLLQPRASGTGHAPPSGPAAPTTSGPWYDRLWSSAVTAGRR
jgi:cell division protein FtsB